MSFILDALKKSESDRQRQSGPSLYEARVLSPRVGLPLPLWAVGIAVLLAINLVIVGWVLLHRPAQAAAARNEPPGYVPVAQSAPQPVAGAYAQPQAGYAQAGLPSQQPLVPQQGMPQPATAQQGVYPQQGGYAQQPGYAQGLAPAQGAQMAAGQPVPPQAALAGMQPGAPSAARSGAEQETQGTADDYAPAVEPASSPLATHVQRATESGLPLYPDADGAPAAGLPALHLDFHAYDTTPQGRLVMINSHRMREGEALPEGVRLESITADGVVLSRGSSRYFLPKP
jgi:general secretion pathway protein B